MSNERWRRVEDICHDALEREAEKRPAFVLAACGGDEELRLEVESLLAQPEAFLTRPSLLMDNALTDRLRLTPPCDRISEDQTHAVMQLKAALAGRYRIERELGRGGMATVYLADDLKQSRKVAIKALHSEMAETIGHQRFLREIKIAARLTHPHILPLHDSGEASGQLYYVMPYIDGESLRVRLNREKQLSIDAALRLTREIASALEYAHQHGVVHRDIKPENVLLAEGIPLVADFGIARAASASDEQHTAAGIIMGTPHYMSPEQAAGTEVDARSDLYSLGCLLYEMLAGEPPFTGPSAMVVLARHALHDMPSLKMRRSGISDELESFVRKSLAKRPADRYTTAAQFVEALSAATIFPTISPQQSAPGRLVPNNLPKEPTRFIGREAELAECSRLLGEARLLTVTGIGGSGKTRLAVRLAEDLLQSHPDGIWFVDLSPLREAARVAEVIAVTLTLSEEPGIGVLQTLARHVSGKRLLLVLDNCEHLVEACGALVDALLRTADDVRVLVTSRESLGIAGERLFALQSLPVPSEARFDFDAVTSSEAVRLFVDRAQIVDREFVLDMQSAPQVAEICRRLDGIPLAIELAAARVKMLSVKEIRSRFDNFHFLTGGSKTLPRHQTLQAAFQWSYDLLTAEEQRLFRILTVFAGGWTLGAATAVWGDNADEFEVLELMTRLVDKSLVLIERLANGTSRYRMLEMSRQFAQEKLDQSDERDARARHLKYFVAWSVEREPMTRGADFGDWLEQVEQEHENVLLALDSCARNRGVAQHALQLAGNVSGYWHGRGMYGVGRQRLGAALRLPGAELPTLPRAAALTAMGYSALHQGALPEARECLEESVTISRNMGDASSIIVALNGLGWVRFEQHDPGAAHACFWEALALAREMHEEHIVGMVGLGLNNLAILAWKRGELPEARAYWEDALREARSWGNPSNVAVVVSNLTDLALRNEAWDEVSANLRLALPIVRDMGLRSQASKVLKQSSLLAAGMRDAERAVRWYAAAAALDHAVGLKREAHKESDTFEARMREMLGGAAFSLATAEGAALGYEDALTEAHSWLNDPDTTLNSLKE